MTDSMRPRRPRMAQQVGEPQEMPAPPPDSGEMADEARSAPRMVEPERIPSMIEQPERWVPETEEAPATEESALVEVVSSGPADATSNPVSYPTTLKEMLARMDAGWAQFKVEAAAWPSERMDERIEEDSWSRKQMLAHITAWHDATHDRLGKMILSGQPEDGVADTDAFNARISRQAIGRTAGEILKEMEMTYNRLRRQVSRLNDQQLRADDGWAAQVIAANTYEHYAEHAADVYQPPADPNARGRR
jgi:Protein of unknown function (DUF1706)